MSYLSKFQTPKQFPPAAPPAPEEVRARVETAVANCPPQYHARHVAPLAALLNQYQEADGFERELLLGEIDARLATLAARSLHWHRLPRFVAAQEGETTEQYLSRCYHASGFVANTETNR